MRPARLLAPDLPPIEFHATSAREPGGVGSRVERREQWGWIAIGICVALLAVIALGGRHRSEEGTSPVPARPAPFEPASATAERSMQFTARRATVSPPTDIGVAPITPTALLRRVDVEGVSGPELILGRYVDDEIGLTLDPAWIVIDREVRTADEAITVVRVVNAVTGRVAFTFEAPDDPVIISG